MKNHENDYDIILIGSGAGGLAASLCLARAEQRVLVLEQHDVPGGWCHSFMLNGYRFSPGVHYIGLLDKGESTSNLYEGLGIANDLVFFRMNPKGYEHCQIGDTRIDLPAGFDELCDSLSKQFPNESKSLRKYLKTVRDVSTQLHLIPKMKGFWDHISIPWRTRHLGKYGLFSLQRVIDWHIKDPLLKQVLNIQCGDHGVGPGKASFPLHCAVMDHYFKGGFYPMGGGASIVKAMTKSIKKYGGEIRTGEKVEKILIDGEIKKRAIGVQLKNGEKLYANCIVSNADPGKTYEKLIGADNLSKRLLEKLGRTKYSCTSLMLFLTVDMDVREAGLDSGNIWLMPDANMGDVYDQMYKKEILEGNEFPGLFISCTTLKDPPSFNGKHHVLEVITFIDYESFFQFKNEGKERSSEYQVFKDKLVEKMLTSLDRVLPNVREKIIHKNLGTPLTNEFYINSTNGCVYGTEKTFKQTGPYSYKSESEIENLYLCGASVLSHGVAGASYSGVQAAATILGCTQDDLLKPDDSQSVQIFEAEDSADYPDWLIKKIKIKRKRFENSEKFVDGFE